MIVPSERPFEVRVSTTTSHAQTMIARALDELFEGDDSEYLEVLDERDHGDSNIVFEIVGAGGAASRFVVFAETIGGHSTAADVLMLLGEIRDVVVEVRSKGETRRDG